MKKIILAGSLMTAGFILSRDAAAQSAQQIALSAQSKLKTTEQTEAILLRNWKDELGLSDQQFSQLQKLEDAFKDGRKILFVQNVSLLQKLLEQLDRNAPDAEIQPTLDQFDRIQRKLHALTFKNSSEMRSVLTATQRAKWELRFSLALKRTKRKAAPATHP